MKKVFCFVLLTSLLFFSFVFAEEFDAKSKAKEVYSNVKEKVSVNENLVKNFVSPMLGNGTLYNLEGSKSFQAGLVCPSTQKFLEIIMQPKSTGDVDFIVYYDTDFNGQFDKNQIFSGISGLCSNGFIRCDSGTWQNCRYYQVRYNGVSLVEEETTSLKVTSCFCLNNSCGSNLAWRNTNYVLSVFGGVVVSAFQSYDSRYAVSKTEVQDVAIRYYGQDVARCQYSPSVESGTSNPSIYFGNPYELTNRGQQEVVSSQFTQLFSNVQENVTERTCTIKRIISSQGVSWTDLVSSSASENCQMQYVPELCGENCVKLTLPIYIHAGGAYSTTLTVVFPEALFLNLQSAVVHWCTDTTGPFPCTDDDGWYYVYVNDVLVASGDYEDCQPCWHYKNIPIDKLHSGENQVSITIGGAGGEYGVQQGCRLIWLYLYFSSLFECYVDRNYIEDNCVSLRNNPECYLKDRITDGVYVVRNRQNTGLIPTYTCNEFCGELYCYNDWVVEERYLCKDQPVNLDFTRPQEVLSTLRYDASLLTFDDVRKNEQGNWASFPGQNLRILLDEGEACPKVCKVKVVESFPEVGEAGPTTSMSKDLERVIYDFRNCVDDVCPYDPAKGEELVANCACLSDFNDALVTFQSIRLAGKDVICSSGNEKTLPGW